MPTLEILGSERAFSANPLRQGQFDRIVTYRREDQTLGFAVTPDETYSLQAAQVAVTKAEQERRMQTPHKFTI